MREKLLSPWLTARVQFVLAALFVVAGWRRSRIPGFAHEIHDDRILPARGSTRGAWFCRGSRS